MEVLFDLVVYLTLFGAVTGLVAYIAEKGSR